MHFRRFYLTQFTEEEILDENTMHDMDMKLMSVYQKDYHAPTPSYLEGMKKFILWDSPALPVSPAGFLINMLRLEISV